MNALPVFVLSFVLLNPLELNGTFWSMLDQGQKEGIASGLIIANVYTAASIVVDNDATRLSVLNNVFPTSDVSLLVRLIDDFYSDGRHDHVLIGEILFSNKGVKSP